MFVSAIKTPLVIADGPGLEDVIDQALPQISNGSVIAVTSKIVSICEGSIVAYNEISKDDLLRRDADLHLGPEYSKYGHHFTIIRNTLISSAGIDESNGEGYYILWPHDAQATANRLRRYLTQKHGLTQLGVIITDSTCLPLRRGTHGISLAYSGFKALRDYVGRPDLFGRPQAFTQANIAEGLASAAVLAMGEGAEQTPLCLLTELPNVEFNPIDPDEAELSEVYIKLEDDLFAPFLTAVPWQKGKQ